LLACTVPHAKEIPMLARIIKLAVLAGAGVAAWKAYGKRGESRPFLEQALYDGVAAVEAARSAQLRGAGAELRRFAQQLEHDHAALNGKLAEAAGVDIPQPDARQRSLLHEIDQQQGQAYDRAWLRHLARSHGRAIRMFQREVEQGGAGTALAAEALPTLREHDRRLTELRNGGGAAENTMANASQEESGALAG
jgi:predicted outer membrane protein